MTSGEAEVVTDLGRSLLIISDLLKENKQLRMELASAKEALWIQEQMRKARE